MVLIFLLLIVNYSFLDGLLIKYFSEESFREQVFVTRVIDGDTIESGEMKIRLLGINSPEKGEKYFLEAKEFLEELIFNKSIGIEFRGKDKYYRELAYLFFESGKNVNVELVGNGFATIYYPEKKDKYYEEFQEAWSECLNKGINLCEMSKNICADCILLEEFNVKNDEVVLRNKCSFDCFLKEWMIKDEGRKEFFFEDFVLQGGKRVNVVTGKGTNTKEKLYWEGEDYVWTTSGDTLFLRDEENKLVLWNSY